MTAWAKATLARERRKGARALTEELEVGRRRARREVRKVVRAFREEILTAAADAL